MIACGIRKRDTAFVIWSAWAISFFLGGAGPIIRAFSGVPGSGSYPIYAAVCVMLIAFYLVRSYSGALVLALTMSASAVATGGSVGFLADAILLNKPHDYFFAAKWAITGMIVTLLYLGALALCGRETSRRAAPPKSHTTMTAEEMPAELERLRAAAQAGMKWVAIGVLLCLVGIVVIASSTASKR